MPYTAPTDDDLAALQTSISALDATATTIEQEAGRIQLVHDRLSLPAPLPPLKLQPVGVGGSGAFGALTPDVQTQVLTLCKAAGITHFRFDCPWSGVETKKGTYNLATVTARAKRVLAAGLVPQVLVGWTPSFYRQPGGSAGANTAPRNDQATLLAWGAFLRALFAALVPLGVYRYEIWNEPNFLFMQPVSPGLWADLVLEAHSVASDISRRIHIVSGGLCPAVDKPPRSMSASAFTDAVLAYEPDFFNFIDAFGIHPYAGDHTKLLDGKFWREQVSHISTLKPVEVPFCGTEHGWKSGKNTEAERATLYTDSIITMPDKQEPLFIFSAFDFAEPYGLLTSQATGFKPKPAYDAVKALLVP